MQADFNLSYAQLGLLPALYMAGLMVACLVFNELTNHINSFRLVGKAQTFSSGVWVGRSHLAGTFAFPWHCQRTLMELVLMRHWELFCPLPQALSVWQGELALCAGIGLAMWALGAIFTGVSFNYGWLLFARIFTGAGMLSFNCTFAVNEQPESTRNALYVKPKKLQSVSKSKAQEFLSCCMRASRLHGLSDALIRHAIAF